MTRCFCARLLVCFLDQGGGFQEGIKYLRGLLGMDVKAQNELARQYAKLLN